MLKQVVHILTTLLKRIHLVLVVNYFRSVRGQSGGAQTRRVLASRSVASLSPDRKVNKRKSDVTFCSNVLCNGGALMSQGELHTSDSLPDDARRGPVSHYLKKNPTQFPNTTTHYNTLQHTTTHYNTPQYTTTHHNTLQHTTTHYNTPQYTTTHHNTLQRLCVSSKLLCQDQGRIKLFGAPRQ